MTAGDYPKAPCADCGRPMRLLKDGTIGHHGGKRLTGGLAGYREYRCKGAGQPPARQELIILSDLSQPETLETP